MALAHLLAEVGRETLVSLDGYLLFSTPEGDFRLDLAPGATIVKRPGGMRRKVVTDVLAALARHPVKARERDPAVQAAHDADPEVMARLEALAIAAMYDYATAVSEVLDA